MPLGPFRGQPHRVTSRRASPSYWGSRAVSAACGCKVMTSVDGDGRKPEGKRSRKASVDDCGLRSSSDSIALRKEPAWRCVTARNAGATSSDHEQRFRSHLAICTSRLIHFALSWSGVRRRRTDLRRPYHAPHDHLDNAASRRPRLPAPQEPEPSPGFPRSRSAALMSSIPRSATPAARLHCCWILIPSGSCADAAPLPMRTRTAHSTSAIDHTSRRRS